MTEEVWEGEDADIARDQLHELSFKEMPDTYDQIDTCNNVIKKAQKVAERTEMYNTAVTRYCTDQYIYWK